MIRRNRHSDAPYGFASYKLLNGLSNGTRRTLLKPAFAHIRFMEAERAQPRAIFASEVVMQ